MERGLGGMSWVSKGGADDNKRGRINDGYIPKMYG